MRPRGGLERPEGRRLSTKMPPLRGSLRFKRHMPACQEITHKFVALFPTLTADTFGVYFFFRTSLGSCWRVT